MDQLIGALADMAASAARGGAEPQAAEKLRQRIEALKAQAASAGSSAPAPAQQARQKPAPAKAPEKASDQTAEGRPAAHTRAPHARHEEHAPHLAQAFHRRSSLLAALVAVETLGPPPALRPRELRGDVW